MGMFKRSSKAKTSEEDILERTFEAESRKDASYALTAVSEGISDFYDALKDGADISVTMESTGTDELCARVLRTYADQEITITEMTALLAEIFSESPVTLQLRESFKDNGSKNTALIVPLTVFTAFSMICTCSKEIIRQEKLEEEGRLRMKTMYEESARMMHDSTIELERFISQSELKQRRMLNSMIASFNYDVMTGENYQEAVDSIVRFAYQAGITLHDTTMEEFSEKMKKQETMVLGIGKDK